MKEKFNVPDKETSIRQRWSRTRTIIVICCIMIAGGAALCAAILMKKGGPSQVTLGEYRGLELTLEDASVTDKDAQDMAEWFINYYNESAVSTRTAVEAGDFAYVTAELSDAEGNAVSPDNGMSGYVMAGPGGAYPEISEKLVGMQVGDTAEVVLTLPDPYAPDESASGKEAMCRITPQSIRGDALSLGTLTDEQVKEAFGMENVDAFYESARSYAEESAKERMRTDAYGQISSKLLETCLVEPFPEAELERRLKKYMDSMEKTCKSYYGMTLSEYCKNIGMSQDEYEKSLSRDMEEKLKLELILMAIADKEAIQYDEEAYESYIDALMSENGYASMEGLYEENDEEQMRRTYRAERVIDWLIDNADVTYDEPLSEPEAEP